MPTPRDILGYMRTVSRGSPVDPKWSVPGMVLTQIRHGKTNAPADSPLTMQDVIASEDYRNLMTAKVAVGDEAPDFELPATGDVAGKGGPRRQIRLSEYRGKKSVVLAFYPAAFTPV